MSQVLALLSTTCTAHSAHASSRDLRGSDSPLAHRLSSMARICVHQVPWPLLC
jgi:hypothetical protein